MAFYQYIGQDHTTTPLIEGGDRVKVREGEIVESELNPEFFLRNGFQAVEGKKKIEVKKEDDGKAEITVEVKRKK